VLTGGRNRLNISLSSAILLYKTPAEVYATLTGHEISDFIDDFFCSQLPLTTDTTALVDHVFVLAKDVAGLW